MRASVRVFALGLGVAVAGCTTANPDNRPQAGPQVQPAPIAAAVAPVAAAVAFRCPPRGAVMTDSLGRVWHYQGSLPDDPEICRWDRDGRQQETAFGFWQTFDPSAGAFRAAFRKLYPLASGREEKFQGLSPGWPPPTHTLTVVGRETITVPAGTFDTWHFRWSRDDGPPFAGQVDVWMTDAGMRIRQEGRVIRGNPRPGSVWLTRWEAMSVSMPQVEGPDRPAAVRIAMR